MTPKFNPDDYPEIKEIRDRLLDGQSSDVVALLIPSKTRRNKDLGEDAQQMWAGQALDLFGDLYTGATAFQHMKGIYKPRDGSKPMFDDPIMVQALAKRADVEDAGHLDRLALFIRNMGEQTDQHTVGLIINNWFIEVGIGGKP